MQFVNIKPANVPALGLGTWQLNGAQCEAAVSYALDIGYRHIDTAQMYGNEREVGMAIRKSGLGRDEIFLTTKLGLDNLAAHAVARSLETSLKALATEYVDLLLVHWPSRTTPLAETLAALVEVKARGRARHIGVSNFTVPLMRDAIEICGAHLFCNQIEYHPFLDQNRVVDYARSHGLMLTAYCPLARGRVAAASEIVAIGHRHDKTAAQVALRWLVQQDGVAAIPKSATRKHIAANLAVFDFSLSATEMATIDRLHGGMRIVNPGFAPDWDPIG